MRVILLSASYVPVLGGLQATTHQLATQLTSQGHQVRVVTNRYPRSLPHREVIDGIRVDRWSFLDSCVDALRAKRADLALASLYLNRTTALRFARLVAEFKPDVVNVHFPEARLASVLLIQCRFPFRLVVSMHGDDVERWFKNSASGIPNGRDKRFGSFRRLLRSADAVTACSRYLLEKAAALEPSIAGKAHVIHNGIDLSRFQETTAHPHGRPYLFAYGRHTRKKGFDLLLRAFASVAGHISPLDLILAGDGEERNELARLCTDLGLAGRVVFYGRATPDQVVRLLNGCTLVAVPSREEPFGIAALEAMLSGRTLVATRVGGLPELAAAVEASCSAGALSVHWSTPEPDELANAIMRALATGRTSGPLSSVAGFSHADMAAGYLRVLKGSAETDRADASRLRVAS